MTGITYMPGAALSPREAEVLALMAEEGCTAKEVAHRLKVSHRTVEIQVANAITKLGARNRMQAIVWFDRSRRTNGVTAGPALVRVEVLRQHWLRAMECDHATGQDKPHCSCSQVDLGWHPSIGAAVEAWLAHVSGVNPSDGKGICTKDANASPGGGE